MISIQTNVAKQSISFMAKDIWNDLPTHLKKLKHVWISREIYMLPQLYCQDNKWNKLLSCWWSNIVHTSSSCFVFSSSFDFTCYLEPKLFRELTRKLTPCSSFSFPAYTLFSLHLIYLLLQVNLLDWNINHVHGQKRSKDYS